MDELHSLPESLVADLQQLANQLVPITDQHPESKVMADLQRKARQTTQSAADQAILEIVRSSPEVLGAIILSRLGAQSVAIIDQERDSQTCGTTTRTKSREIRLQLQDQPPGGKKR